MDDRITDTVIYGVGAVSFTSNSIEVYTVTGDKGQIVEIIYKTLRAYISPWPLEVHKAIKGAKLRGHQVNPHSRSLAVWYWKDGNATNSGNTQKCEPT